MSDERVTLRLVMASANPHKVQQMIDLMAGLAPSVGILPRPASVPDVVEDADSLVGNARLKARAVCAAAQMASVADDTGLFVDALDGQPGVHTAYFAGPENDADANNAKLLCELDQAGATSPDRRTATFRTVAMVCFPDGREVIAHGEIPGHIALSPRGSGGFGYDPLFVPDAGSETLAEMPYERKQQLSHRFRAFSALSDELRRLGLIV
jgi:XTP/dITP diphosphohydrolase